MARASRGSARAWDVHPVCPSACVLTVDVVDENSWDLSLAWSPAVGFATVVLQYSLDNVSWTTILADGNPPQPYGQNIDVADYAESGDTIYIRCLLTDGGACGDLTSNVVFGTVT